MKGKFKQAIAWVLVACLLAGTGAFNGITLWAAESSTHSRSYASSSDSSREEIIEDEYEDAEDLDEEELGETSELEETETSTDRYRYEGDFGVKSEEETEEDDSEEIEPEEDWDTASPSDIIEIELASFSDLEPYTYEFLTPEGILISIECEDVDWSDDVTVKVEKVTDEDTETINSLVNDELAEQAATEGSSSLKAGEIFAYDISFWKNDVEFEPEGTIKVTFELPEDMLGTSDAGIIHVDDDLTEAKLMDTTEEEENTYSCTADGFSVYGIALLASSGAISNAQDLQNIKNDLYGDYYLTNDIDLADIKNWEPIGTEDAPFMGTLTGYKNYASNEDTDEVPDKDSCYTISGLSITTDNADGLIGLFGCMAGTVENINIEDFTINIKSNPSDGELWVGSVAGWIPSSGYLYNCYVDNTTVQAETDVVLCLGGITGYFGYGKGSTTGVGFIDYCTFSGEVNGICHAEEDSGYALVGGICGLEDGFPMAYIWDCTNLGDISCNTDDCDAEVGGICGENSWAYIRRCANFGEIKAISNSSKSHSDSPAPYAGGIVGVTYESSIMEVYNAGTVNSECAFLGDDEAFSLSGGIAGLISAYLTDAYNVGDITAEAKAGSSSGDTYAGGLAGAVAYGGDERSGIIYFSDEYKLETYFTNCYYRNNTSEGKSINAIGKEYEGDTLYLDNVKSCQLSAMTEQETFEGFDFEGTWQMGLKDYSYPYPVLQSQREVGEGPDPTEEERKFTLGRDNNQFYHGGERGYFDLGYPEENAYLIGFRSIGEEKDSEGNTVLDEEGRPVLLYNNTISDEHLDSMFEVADVNDVGSITGQIENMKYGAGRCYGLSATMGLAYENIIPIDEMTDKSTDGQYFNLGAPCDDEKLMELINYFHVCQNIDSSAILGSFYSSHLWNSLYWLFDNIDKTLSINDFIDTLVSELEKGHPVLLGYNFLDGNENAADGKIVEHGGAHAILATEVEYDENNLPCTIKLYDQNTVDPNCPLGETYDMEIERAWGLVTEFHFTENGGAVRSSSGKNACPVFVLISLDKLNNLEASERTSSRYIIQFGIDSDFTIVNNSGDSLVFNEGILSGDMNVYDAQFNTCTSMDGDESFLYQIEIDSNDLYNIIINSDNIDISIGSNTDYFSIKGNSIDEITVSLGNEIILKGDNYSFDALIATEKEVTETGVGLTSVVADATSDVIIKLDDGKLIVSSDNNLKNITTGIYERLNLMEHEYSASMSGFDVVSGEIVTESGTGSTGGRRSSGGSGGSGGGGGGGSSSSSPSLGTYSSGTWIQNEDGTWSFSSNGVLATGWSYIRNPYADTTLGQSEYDWFHFSDTGIMDVGWLIDTDGNMYYLNPASDGTQGRMLTGWQWIPGADGLYRCYYFETESTGYQGSLYRSTVTPDGNTVDANGAMTVGGVEVVLTELQ